MKNGKLSKHPYNQLFYFVILGVDKYLDILEKCEKSETPPQTTLGFVLCEGKRVILLCNGMCNYRDTPSCNSWFLSYLRIEWLFTVQKI